MKKKLLLLTLVVCWFGLSILLICLTLTQGQPAPFAKSVSLAEAQDGVSYDAWIEFKDKDIRSQKQRKKILKELEKNYHPRALKRRRNKRTFPGLFDERDFPLAAKYLKGVRKTGAELRIPSRWLNGISVLATKQQLLSIQALPYVKQVTDLHLHRPRAQKEQLKPSSEPRTIESPGFYGYSGPQIRQLGLDRLHQAGYTGSGIVIAVLDCGFDLSHIAFRHPQHPLKVVAQKDFVENDGDVIPRPGIDPTNYDHGTLVLGIVAAYCPEKLVGTAFDAGFILCNAEDGEEEYYLEEKWFVAALEFAEARGADIVTSSLVLYYGYSQEQSDGKTSVMTRGLNIAVGNGVISLEGAGNYGHDQDPATSHLLAPADPFHVITVGAVNKDNQITDFSSDGPTTDGRLKPEVLARGEHTWTVSLEDNHGYSRARGTSMATPVMAGAVACLLQVRPDWTVAELRRALFHSGDYYLRHGKPDPLYVHGYGIPDVFAASGLTKKK